VDADVALPSATGFCLLARRGRDDVRASEKTGALVVGNGEEAFTDKRNANQSRELTL